MSETQRWVADMKATGRVVVRLPFAIGLVQAGQLGSRLAVPDYTRGIGRERLDYQVAPFGVRWADNWSDTRQDVANTIAEAFPSFDDVATATGQVVHIAARGVGEVLAAALGVPPWMVWGGVALGLLALWRHPEVARRAVTGWR